MNGQDCPPVPAHNRKFSYSVWQRQRFFGNHQQIEVITQARAFQTHLLQGTKAVGDDADFGVATNGVKQRNRARQRRADFRHRINKGFVEFTWLDVQPFGPAQTARAEAVMK